MTGDVLDVESGDRVYSVEQNKAPALTELLFLWEMEPSNKIQINEKHLLGRMSVMTIQHGAVLEKRWGKLL